MSRVSNGYQRLLWARTSRNGEFMKHFIARQNLITKLATLALSMLCFLQGQIHAQRMTGYILIFPSVGLAPGQTLRLTLFNPDDASVRAQARVHPGGVNFIFVDGSVRAGDF